MARRISKKPARRAAPPAAAQPLLPNIVTGALDVGSHVGRFALRTAQDALAAAARLVVGTPGEAKATRPSGAPDSRLPAAALNAIVDARRRQRGGAVVSTPSRRRKPPARTPSRAAASAARSRRRMKG
jgi:hypothetical protein